MSATETKRARRTKTACRHGHAYDAANTYLDPRGRRQCRKCNAERSRVYRQTPDYRQRNAARMRAYNARRRAARLAQQQPRTAEGGAS